MSRVILHSLVLAGFGVHAQRTFRFAPGINTLVSPNETGKSTLLAGILAVLYGLPERTDPAQWGTARFQSWSDPQPFRGELILHAGDHWHRIRRDFSDHAVDWTRAKAAKLPAPSDKVWQEHFRGEHNPSGRGEPVLRYRQALRELLGIDDLDLFRLTFCLAQDIDERSEEEEAFRTREVPRDVQELLSGSGGRVDDVRALLFDAFAEISMATGDAELVRPGKKRPRNQQTRGHLERVKERLAEARRELHEAGSALELLQGSQEKLEEIRRSRDEQSRHREEDRALLTAWDTWLGARAEQRERHKRIIDIETALRQVETLASERRQSEQELRRNYSELQAANFDFVKGRAQIEELLDLEEERGRIGAEMERAREQIESHQKRQEEVGSEIDSRFAPFARNRHLPRDFQAWGQLVREADEIRKDLATLDREIRDSENALQRIGRWAALDPCADDENTPSRPLTRLRDLSARAPRLLEHAIEVQRLAAELAKIRARLEGPLRTIAAVPEELRRDASTFAERIELLREQTAETDRRAREATERRSEVEARAIELELEYRAICADLGEAQAASPSAADVDELRLPPGWITLQAAIGEKLSHLQEEGDLLRQAAAIPRMVRPSASRQIFLPALIAFVLVGIAAFTASLILAPDMPWRIPTAILAALMAAIIVAALTFRRSSAPVLEGLPAALERLQVIRGSIDEVNRRLGSLRDLDGRALDALRQRLESFATGRAMLARLQSGVPSSEEVAQLRAEAKTRASELAGYESRMAALGDDPAGQAAEWAELTRRSEEITRRLSDLESEVGPPNWAQLPIPRLPAVWSDLARLASVVASPVPVGAEHAHRTALQSLSTGESEPAPAEVGLCESAAEVAAILSQAGPGDWDAWISEAQRFEQAHGRLVTLRSRRTALDERDETQQTRLERLEEQIAALAAACAPYTLATSPDDLAWTAHEYEKQREAREKAGTLGEKATADLGTLEGRAQAQETAADAKREELTELLRPASGNPEQARERLRQAEALRRLVSQSLTTEKEVLRSHNVTGADDLGLKMESLRDENNLALKSIREQEERFPLFREIADAGADEIQKRHSELARRIEKHETRIAELDRQRERLQQGAAEAQAEGRRAGNVAVLEMEITSLQSERKRLSLERDALQTAFEAVGEAEELFAGTHRERLAERTTEIFRQLTGGSQRSITLDGSFAIGVRTADGHTCVLRQLSQGARDQLALSLRLAISELLSETRAIPLLLDDPFLTFDAERLQAMREALSQLAQERQILLLTHRSDFAKWGTPVRASSPGG